MLEDLNAADLNASDLFVQIGVDPSECSANDPDTATRSRARDTFARAIELCVALGCPHLTGLPGVYHTSTSRGRDFEIAAEEAAWRVSQCAQASIRYAIEPHVGSICADVESARRFLSAVEGLTLTLDYGHFIVAGVGSAQVHELLPFASHIHVRGGAVGQLQASLEENSIDFPGMLQHLQQLGYDGFLALEYVWVNWKNCNRTDNISETLLLRQALESSASLTAIER
jgi:sugar phosphate isomerase/epimerase